MASNRNEPPKSSGDFDFFANFDEYADELEKEFEEEMKTEGELEKNTDLDDESLKKFNFFNDENEEENIEKVGKNDVDKPEENNKEDALGEDEELVREREYDYSQYANGTNPASSEELDSPEEEIDEKTGSAADVDEEVAAIDEKWLEDQKKAKQMAKDEADKRIREIYERAHRHTQHAAQSQNATGTPSGVEVANQESSALEIKTAADDIIDRQSLPESENADDTEVKHALNEEGNSNTFEMERERVPDYNRWRTTPRTDSVDEEVKSPNVTEAAGIEQEVKNNTFKTSATNMLKKQGVPGASDATETLGKIDDLEAEIENVTPSTTLNSKDARKEGNSSAFEMERERIPDYSQWRTTPREHKPVEETTSHSVTDAAGISQSTEEKSLNSSATKMLKKQGVPGAPDATETLGKIDDLEAEIGNVTPSTTLNSKDARKEGNSNVFEMERERVPDYNQWRTAPREHKSAEEMTSHSVTDAAGISQSTEEKSLNSSATKMLKKQGVPGAPDATETLGKIDDLEAEIGNVTPSTTLNSKDARKEGNSNVFEMERERVPDYNQWRTAPREHKSAEEMTSHSVTDAAGISQSAEEKSLNSATANLLKKQGVPGPSNVEGTAGAIQQADAAKNAAKSVTSGASSIGSGIASSTARNSDNVDEERNKQAKSIQSAAKSSIGALGYLNSKNNVMPTKERGSSPSGSVTGASGISEAPKEDSAAGGWQHPGLGNGKSSVKPVEPVNGKEKRDVEYVRSLEKGSYGQSAQNGHNAMTPSGRGVGMSSGGSITGAPGIQDAPKAAPDAAKTAKKTTDVLQKGAKINAFTGAVEVAGATSEAAAALLHKKDGMRPKFSGQEDGGFADVTGTSKKAGIAHIDISKKTEKTDPLVKHLNQDEVGLSGKRKLDGSQTIKVNGKKVSATEDIEAKGFTKGKVASKDSSFSYDEKTGKVKLGGLKAKDTSVDKHMRGRSETRIIDSDEAVKRSHAVNGKGIAGKKEDIVIKNGDKLKISPHGTMNAEQTVTTKENGKIRIGKQGTPGISSSGTVAGIKKAENPGKGPQVGGRQAKERARDRLRTENATSEYLRGSVAKNKAIKLSRDGTISEGRAGELLEAAEENEGGLSRLKTGSSRRTKSTNRAAKSRTAKMNVGRGARAGTGKAGALAASAQDAKKASSQSLRFRRMWGLNQQTAVGAVAEEPAKQATKKIAKATAKKVVAASLTTTLALGAGTAGQVRNSSKSDQSFNDVYFLPQAHISSEYGNEDAPVMTKNAMTKMGQRLNAYQTLANGGTATGDDASTKNLHDIKISSATLNGSSIDSSGITFKNAKDFTTNYTYSVTTTYPAHTETRVIPKDERGPDGKKTKEVIIPAETLTATKTESLSVGGVSVNFEFDDKDGNPLTIGSGAIKVGDTGTDITATGEAGKIIEAAKKRVGGKYLWGGNQWGSGPSDTAVDCSHYVWHVLMEAGVYNGGYRTAVEWKTAGRPVASLEKAQAGDVIVYGDHHVGIYDGNGYIYEAKGKSYGITHDRKADHESPYVIRRFAADGAAVTVNNKKPSGSSAGVSTGGTSAPTSGTVISVPSGLGRYFAYMGWQCITAPDSLQYKLREKAGMNFDDEGFGVIDGRYVIACTTTFGQVGDLVDFYQSDGTVLHTIIGDIKNQSDPGCTKWGHNNGQVIVEFVVNRDTWYNSSHANPGTASCHPEWGGKTITQGVNLGSWDGNSRVSASSAASSMNSRTYFMKEILAMSTLGGYYASPADVEKYNQYCFDILDYAVADWKGAEVAYTVLPSGSDVTLNDGRSDVTTTGMQLSCSIIVHVCTDLKILEENDPNYKGVWDTDATEQGDALPYHFMQLEPKIFDLIFNINTSNSFGGGALTEQEREIYDFFSNKGLSDVAIAGILANISRESSFDPTCVNSSSGASGLFQWLGGRLTVLKNYAASKGKDWTDKQCQLELAWAEMSGDGSVPGATMQWSQSLWSQFQSTSDPYEAGSMFGHYWERYGSATEDDTRGKLAETYYGKISGSGGTAYMQWALEIAADDSHGYSQINRNGNPDYDCSSLVYYSLYNTGWPIASICPYAFATGSMDSVLTQLGFQKITFSNGDYSSLVAGDILLREGHTEIYIGNGQTVGAHSDEVGGITGAQGGDQTGREISVVGFGNWSVAYRAPGN